MEIVRKAGREMNKKENRGWGIHMDNRPTVCTGEGRWTDEQSGVEGISEQKTRLHPHFEPVRLSSWI